MNLRHERDGDTNETDDDTVHIIEVLGIEGP